MSSQIASLRALLQVAEMAQHNYQQYLASPEDGSDMSHEAFVREFRTIHLNVGRRSGKSSLIAELATQDDVVIVADNQRAQYIRPYFKPYYKSWVITANIAKRMDDAGGPYSTTTWRRVWVDEPNDVFQLVSRNSLYRAMVNSHATSVVMLGE